MPQSAHKYRNGFEPTFHLEELDRPKSWRKPRKIFVGSMGDLFGCGFSEDDVDAIFETVEACPQHTFLFLTKNTRGLFVHNPWPSNAWVGATVTNQRDLVARMEGLLEVEAPVRFLSIEPLVSPIGLGFEAQAEWIIIGRGTGPVGSKLPFEPAWVTDLTEQAHRLGIPVFHKDNLGDLATVFEFPEARHDQ